MYMCDLSEYIPGKYLFFNQTYYYWSSDTVPCMEVRSYIQTHLLTDTYRARHIVFKYTLHSPKKSTHFTFSLYQLIDELIVFFSEMASLNSYEFNYIPL